MGDVGHVSHVLKAGHPRPQSSASAGDWWETRGTLPVEPLNAVINELSTWTEAGLPMLMLVGNVRAWTAAGFGSHMIG